MDRLFYSQYEEITGADAVLDQVLMQKHLDNWVRGSVGYTPPDAATTEALCILNGLSYGQLAGRNGRVSSGSMIFRSPAVSSDYPDIKFVYSSSNIDVTHDNTDGLNSRWDIVEVSFVQDDTYEDRSFRQTIGTFVRFITQNTLKRVKWRVVVRIRSGTLAPEASARLPVWDNTGPWLPIAGVLIDQTGVIKTVLDLRLMASSIGSNTLNGYDQASIRGDDTFLYLTPGYVSFPRSDSPCVLPIFGNGRIPNANHEYQFSISSKLSPTSTLTPLNPYYVYAHRPYRRVGYVDVVVSNVRPTNSSGLRNLKPASALELPPPWPSGTTGISNFEFVYLCTITGHLRGGTYNVNTFNKTGHKYTWSGKSNQDASFVDYHCVLGSFGSFQPLSESVAVRVPLNPSTTTAVYAVPSTAKTATVLVEVWSDTITSVPGVVQLAFYDRDPATTSNYLSITNLHIQDTSVDTRFNLDLGVNSSPASNFSEVWVMATGITTGTLGVRITVLGYTEVF